MQGPGKVRAQSHILPSAGLRLGLTIPSSRPGELLRLKGTATEWAAEAVFNGALQTNHAVLGLSVVGMYGEGNGGWGRGKGRDLDLILWGSKAREKLHVQMPLNKNNSVLTSGSTSPRKKEGWVCSATKQNKYPQEPHWTSKYRSATRCCCQGWKDLNA